MTSLDKYGAACRCLLRLRENGGLARMSDAEFVARFVTRYPDWYERPGTTDILRIGEVARALGLADSIEVYRDYDKILQDHRAGRPILICTDRIPELDDGPAVPGRYVLLLVEMNDTTFTAWRPQPDGRSDTLPPTPRRWWDQWQAIGIALFPPKPVSAGRA